MKEKIKTQEGFIQIPLLIAIIMGVLVIGGAGYIGVRQYQNYQAEKIVQEKEREGGELKKQITENKKGNFEPNPIPLNQNVPQEFNKNNQNEVAIISLIKKEILGYQLYITKITANGTEKEIQDVKNSGMPQELIVDWLNIDLDKYAQRIGQNLAEFHYPKQAANNLTFVIVNIKPDNLDKYSLRLPDNNLISGDFLFTMGGLYTSNGRFGIITLNQSLSIDFNSALAHELGHHLGSFLTREEKERYYELRGIPKETSWFADSWHLSPAEDFAEVYKSIFKPPSFSSGVDEAVWQVRTGFGKLLSPPLQFGIDNKCNPLSLYKSEDDKTVQECRRLAVAKGSAKDDAMAFLYTTPYVSSVDQETKQFITNFLSRLSR